MIQLAEHLEAYSPSEVCIFYYYKQEGIWFLNIPDCGVANLANHTVVEHEDGTISVTPSILTSKYWKGEKVNERHGYLTKSIWTEC